MPRKSRKKAQSPLAVAEPVVAVPEAETSLPEPETPQEPSLTELEPLPRGVRTVGDVLPRVTPIQAGGSRIIELGPQRPLPPGRIRSAPVIPIDAEGNRMRMGTNSQYTQFQIQFDDAAKPEAWVKAILDEQGYRYWANDKVWRKEGREQGFSAWEDEKAFFFDLGAQIQAANGVEPTRSR